MKTLQYLVRINCDSGSDWGASVPDLPGCVATGKTIDSALRRIGRAIEIHIRGLREDGLRFLARTIARSRRAAKRAKSISTRPSRSLPSPGLRQPATARA